VLGSQVRRQTAPLAGATSAVLTLRSAWADLRVVSADLPGQAMSGRIILPDADRVVLKTAREGATLNSASAVPSSSAGTSEPFRIGWSGNGLEVNPAGSDRMGLWAVQIGREVPSDLRFSSTSGDLNLNLAGVKLKALDLSTRSGDVQLELPGSRIGMAQSGAGTVSLRSFSGNIGVTSGKASTLPAGQPKAAGTFRSQSESGDQRLDLSGAAAPNVVVGSTTGNLDLTAPGVPDLTATVTTLSGNQTVTVPAQVKRGSLTLNSTIGDLELRVPAGSAVRVTVSTRLGDVSVPDGFVRQGDTYLSPAAQPSDAPLDITVSTLSGDVTVDEVTK
jgi:DUF4097 and DUF4098 domain-containing protein YvlB